MPHIPEHFNSLLPSDRLMAHNIGLKQEIMGLFTQYNKTQTSYRVNESMRWSYAEANARPIKDFCFDLKNNLMFFVTDQHVYCLGLKTGSLIWKQSFTTGDKIACSPKNKWIYVADSTNFRLKRYDYNFSFINEVSYGNSRVCNKPVVDDRYDLVILTWSGYSGTLMIRVKTVSTALTAISTFSDSASYSKVALSKSNKIYFVIEGTLRYVSNNNLAAYTTIASVNASTGRDITFTVEDDYAYVSGYSNFGNPLSSYYLYKIDLVNKTIVWTKSIDSTETGQTNNKFFTTHDLNYVYYFIEPQTSTDGIEKAIKVVNKSDGSIAKNLPLNPDGFFTDSFIAIWHTYDSIK